MTNFKYCIPPQDGVFLIGLIAQPCYSFWWTHLHGIFWKLGELHCLFLLFYYPHFSSRGLLPHFLFILSLTELVLD